MKQSIFFVTWASGVWKTTLIEWLKEKYDNARGLTILSFDSIWVPSQKEMIGKWGSGENWQKAMTEKWAKKITREYSSFQNVILEWQVNLDFICSVFKWKATIILLDCSKAEMSRRLDERNQPELATEDMENWRQYLRNQAQKLNAIILQTDGKTKDEVLSEFEEVLKINLIESD